ncbi:MAG: hypothetical protein PHS44_06330, partial [Candidatus Dojkabacteria bacterium]|nr:hypothetical protein [Candidatus Dojkabacteria bacterium]
FILTKARKLVLRDIFQPIDLIILLVIILLFGVLYLIDPAILYFEAAIIGVSVLAYLSSIFVPYQILKFR